LIGGFAAVIGQFSDGSQIAVHRSLGFAGELEVFSHLIGERVIASVSGVHKKFDLPTRIGLQCDSRRGSGLLELGVPPKRRWETDF
jgi:hypothetical protein